ncbi:MAG: ABC transporter permease [Nocardioides sp.]
MATPGWVPAMTAERWRSVGVSAAGVVTTVVLWWVAAELFFTPKQVPTPGAVLDKAVDRGFDYYREIFSITLKEAATGYAYGVGIALALAVLVLLVPFLEPLIMQFAVITYCLPIIVLAPILIIIHDIPAKGESSPTAVDLAAVSVVFTTVVGAIMSLRAADRSSLDLITVYGGGAWQQFRRVRLVSSLPGLFTTLQIAAPAAFLGALLGEWFDKHMEIGVGPSLYLSMNNRETELAWTLGFGCAIVSGVAYLVLGLLGRAVTPWSRGAS